MHISTYAYLNVYVCWNACIYNHTESIVYYHAMNSTYDTHVRYRRDRANTDRDIIVEGQVCSLEDNSAAGCFIVVDVHLPAIHFNPYIYIYGCIYTFIYNYIYMDTHTKKTCTVTSQYHWLARAIHSAMILQVPHLKQSRSLSRKQQVRLRTSSDSHLWRASNVVKRNNRTHHPKNQHK